MSAYSDYPLVEKALEEQRRIFKNVDGGIPEELEKATLRSLDLIATHVDSPHKESMMAVSVLMNCPPYISLRSKRFAADYGDKVQEMLDVHAKGDGITRDNLDLIQVYSAQAITHGENLLAKIEKMSAKDAPWLKDMREGIEEYLEDRAIIEEKIAPGLRALENNLIKKTFAAIDRHLQAIPRQKIFGKKGPGPSA